MGMILEVDGVGFTYPGTPVLEEISFSIPRGEFLGVVGPNGSGKSTLLRLLDRILLPDAGSIRLKGRDLGSFTRLELSRVLAYVPQDLPWVFPFTVEEVVLMGRSPHVGRRFFERSVDRDIARSAMERVDLLHCADHPITAVSGGERQRALIARALAQEPEILLLDEPNAHLDVAHQITIFQILRERNIDRALTILCVSHDLTLTAAFSTSMLLLGKSHVEPRGAVSAQRVLAWGKPDEVLTAETLRRAFGTPVLVDRHPTAGSPRVTCDTRPHSPASERP